MSQNIYDNPAFFAGYAQLPRSQFGLDGAPEWPAIQRILPELAGKRVLDLGCGYGWFCRYAREHGATEVTGIDLSSKMLARATELTQDPAITYCQGDLNDLALATDSYDLIYSALALHYLPELEPLLTTVYQALAPGGQFIFTTEHPIYTCSPHQGWVVDHRGQRSWAVNHYQDEGQRVSNWLADGVIKYHRTLGTILNGLIGAGFIPEHVNEWGPSAVQIAAAPELAEEAERPMMVIIAARRGG